MKFYPTKVIQRVVGKLYFAILRNLKFITSHNMNVFILKAHYVKETASDQPCDCSMDFFKNSRKVVTPIRKSISSLDLAVDKHFDQMDSIPLNWSF